MIDRCANSPVVGILSSHSSSSYFAVAATTHHSPMMLLPRWHNTTHNLVWRLLWRQLQCQQGCASSPCWKGIADCLYKTVHIPTYNTTHNQPTTSVNAWWPKWRIAAVMVPHSRFWCIQQLPRMMVDCCLWWRQEWGTMAAVRRRYLPRPAGHGLASFS